MSKLDPASASPRFTPVTEPKAAPNEPAATAAAPAIPKQADDFVQTTQARAVTRAAPVTQAEFEASMREILRVAEANTNNPDTKTIAALLKPHFDIVGAYFAAHRPPNEVELTKGVWRQLWYINPDIENIRGPVDLNENEIFQDVRDDFYMNVSESWFKLFGLKLFKVTGFLRGNYTLTNPADANNRGEEKLNVITLKFDKTRAALGGLDTSQSIAARVDKILSGKGFTFPTGGPEGIEGELWNIFIGEFEGKEVRIARGAGGRPGNTTDQYYVLVRAN